MPSTCRARPTRRRIVKEPAGVVGAITPWNFPFEVTINKLAQALATGNTVVLKPAPTRRGTPRSSGVSWPSAPTSPPGCSTSSPASDHLVGEELTLSPMVDLISFTGSTAVGKRIMEKGAATLKRLFLELGGKSATIVLDDADMPTAAMMGLAVCTHAGQGCAIPTRMLLPAQPLRRRCRAGHPDDVRRAVRRSAAPRRPPGSAHLGQAARASARLHREGQAGRGDASSSAAASPRGTRRATSSSRRCSSTSTTP